MLSKLELHNFKIHKNKTINFKNKLSIISGKNGAGKTSVLEAISLFTSGKGIFNISSEELINTEAKTATVQVTNETAKFKINLSNKKEIEINNEKAHATTLLEHIKILGLTPYTTLAFWQDSSLRRAFFNRIILQNNIIYGNIYTKYTKTLKQRNLLIANANYNAKWKEILDPIIQSEGLKITEIREKEFQKIQNNISEDLKNFLKEELEIKISPSSAEQREILTKPLSEFFIGPQQSKIILATKNQRYLSTGQQKKLLLTLVLASLNLNLNDETENILLLDDVLSTLDEKAKEELIYLLKKQKVQTILTNPTKIIFDEIENISLE